MRKYVLAVILLLSVLAVHAQGKGDKHKKVVRDNLPYMKYTDLPAFNIRLMDSTTVFNTFNIPTGQPVALMLFDPGCKHCHDVITELVRGMDSLKNISFYFITFSGDFKAMRAYYNEFNMGKYPNIKAMGRDYEFFYMDYYGVNSFPDVALYNADKQFLHLFEGRATVKELYEYTHK